VANNPVVYTDPGGEYLDVAIDLGFTAYSIYRLGHAVLTGGDVKGEAINLALDAGGILVPGAVGFGTAKRASQAALNSGEAAVSAKKVSEDTYSVYQGIDRTTGEVKYVGITKRNPNDRFSEHRRSKDGNRNSLEFDTINNAVNLSRNNARVIEQAIINNKGLSRNGGALVNKINSVSPAKQAAALSAASNATRAASDAIGRGDYAAAIRYLGQVSRSLNEFK
jgi:hypothetical protein